MKKVAICLLLSVILFGCAFKRSSIYLNKDIYEGVSKNFIIKKYGNPFKEDMLKKNDDLLEIICYKENIYVGAYEYILSTYFYFKNSKLIQKEQIEEEPPSNLKVKIKKE